MQESQQAGEQRGVHAPVFHYTVDDEPQSTSEHSLTPREIMMKAGINPDQNYLVEIKGRERESFKDTPDKPIQMHEDQKFVTVFVGSVPVS